jgi:hypothetical protein
MKKGRSLWMLALVVGCACAGLVVLLSMGASAQQPVDIADSALEQIAAIAQMKQGFTDAQKKIDSNLLFAEKSASGELAGTSIANVGSITDTVAAIAPTPADALQSNVAVDIYGNVTAGLLNAIAAAGGTTIDEAPQWGIVRALVPLNALEAVAANADVHSIRPAERAKTNVGALTSQGYISHRANQAVAAGINGAGVTVGVLSDSASPARIAALIATGDLPATTQVLPGQDGGARSDEGAAMMEIVHDVAPGPT